MNNDFYQLLSDRLKVLADEIDAARQRERRLWLALGFSVTLALMGWAEAFEVFPP